MLTSYFKIRPLTVVDCRDIQQIVTRAPFAENGAAKNVCRAIGDIGQRVRRHEINRQVLR